MHRPGLDAYAYLVIGMKCNEWDGLKPVHVAEKVADVTAHHVLPDSPPQTWFSLRSNSIELRFRSVRRGNFFSNLFVNSIKKHSEFASLI